MPNTNFQTFHQMGNAINDVVRQATGRDNVQNIDMDFVTVAQRTRWIEHVVSGDIVTFETNMVSPLNYLMTNIFPVQNLHGYGNSWLGGAGKNLLPITGSTMTVNGITFTVVKDSDDNIVSVTATGTASAGATFNANISCALKAGSYVLNGCPSDGASSGKWRIRIGDSSDSFIGNDTGSGYSFTLEEDTTVTVKLVVELVGSVVDLTFYPMIRLSTETDATFAPYSNVCPISGWDSVQITRTGKNLIDVSSAVMNKNIDASGNINDNNSFMYTMTKVKSGTDYMLSFNSTATSSATTTRIHGYDEYGNWKQQLGTVSTTEAGIRTKQISIPDDVYFVAVSTRQAFTDFMLEEGSTASTYEAYTGNTYPISLPTTAYGGMLKIEKDGSGTLTIDKILIVVDGTEYFSNVTANNMFYIQSDAYEELSDTSQTTDLCNMFVIAGEELQDGMINHEAESKNIYIKSSVFSGYTGEQLATYFASNNLQLTCDLIESETITLTAEQIYTLVGENNIWTDTDNVTVSYNVKREVI